MHNIKTLLIVFILFTGFVGGLLAGYIHSNENQQAIDIVFVIIAVSLIFLWYHKDSSELGYKRSPFLNISIIAFSTLAIPYYLFKSRGAKNGAIGVGIFICLVLLDSALYKGGEYISQTILIS